MELSVRIALEWDECILYVLCNIIWAIHSTVLHRQNIISLQRCYRNRAHTKNHYIFNKYVFEYIHWMERTPRKMSPSDTKSRFSHSSEWKKNCSETVRDSAKVRLNEFPLHMKMTRRFGAQCTACMYMCFVIAQCSVVCGMTTIVQSVKKNCFASHWFIQILPNSPEFLAQPNKMPDCWQYTLCIAFTQHRNDKLQSPRLVLYFDTNWKMFVLRNGITILHISTILCISCVCIFPRIANSPFIISPVTLWYKFFLPVSHNNLVWISLLPLGFPTLSLPGLEKPWSSCWFFFQTNYCDLLNNMLS